MVFYGHLRFVPLFLENSPCICCYLNVIWSLVFPPNPGAFWNGIRPKRKVYVQIVTLDLHHCFYQPIQDILGCFKMWESKDTPPGNKALIRPYKGIVLVNNPQTRPYFLGGWRWGGVQYPWIPMVFSVPRNVAKLATAVITLREVRFWNGLDAWA